MYIPQWVPESNEYNIIYIYIHIQYWVHKSQEMNNLYTPMCTYSSGSHEVNNTLTALLLICKVLMQKSTPMVGMPAEVNMPSV